MNTAEQQNQQVAETLPISNNNVKQSYQDEQSMYEWLVENGQAVDDTERTSL